MERWAVCLCAVAVAAGCDPGSERAQLRYVAEHRVAAADGDHFDGVSLVARPGGALALWSDPGGTHLRPLGPGGRPVGPARRLGAPCTGGMATAGTGDDLLLGCLAAGEEGSEARLIHVRGEEVRTKVLEAAGRDGRGISVARDGDRAWVAWHDGTPGGWRIRLAELGLDDLAPGPVRTLSNPARAAETPTLLHRGDGPIAVWMESWIDPEGYPEGRLMLWNGGHRVEPVTDIHWSHPRPWLAQGPQGAVIGFRDLRGRKRAQLYVQRLAEDLRPMGEPMRVGRADGPGPARLIDCEPPMALAPRTWGKHDLVTLAPLTDGLRPTGEVQHVYQWGAAYVRGDGRCEDDRVVLLLAERRTRVRWEARLITAVVRMP